MIGLAGIFSGIKAPKAVSFTLGAIFSSVLRFLSHFLSGVFAFGAYAEGQNIYVYSLAYNSFVFVDIAITIAAGILLLLNASFRQTVEIE